MKKTLLLAFVFSVGLFSLGYSQGCGTTFTDPGGDANYANNTDYTITICPDSPGDMVTVTFTTFSTEATYDALYVYDGNTTTAPQILSTNPAANVPGSVAGGFWGNAIPGPFTATSATGCLTFRFRSDGSVNATGWIANVTCAPPPSCPAPLDVIASAPTLNSITLNWYDTVSTSWEVLALPFGTTPSPTATGQTVTTNPFTVTGLTQGTGYSFYVRANCAAGDKSFWSLRANAYTLIANDDCSTALTVPVGGRNCTQPVVGSLTGATASTDPITCTTGIADDDVWFKFVATNPTLNVTLSNVAGTTPNLNMVIYSGACNSLNQIHCGTGNSLYATLSNLTVGNTYYVRVYSILETPQTVTFNVCITIPSTCADSESICGVNNYSNTTGVPSLGPIGCLSTTPNPTYFTLKIAGTGPVNLLLTQSTFNTTTPNLDVDYAAWGPFATRDEGCAAISGGQAPGIGVPVSITTGCSYSAAPTEILNIANAQAGQYYIILITNFSNQAGYINVSQSNVNEAGAGSIDCSGIRLNAFVDTNANGTQDSGEVNFPLGQFHYELNNNGNPHAITAPTGSYILYDQIPGNFYNLSYTINSDFGAQYTTPTGFNNVSVATGMMTTYNFPVTIVQSYADLGVTIVPQSSPRAGSTYTVKIIYTNNGNQTLPTGVLTFNNNVGTSITNISQAGTTPITNGFTYIFNNLLPYETRTIIVTISVPPIPTVSLGQLLTDTVSIVPPSGDIVANNNSSSVTQAVVGSYDPNDKVEGHGEKILITSFTSNDYLEYTIRFENSGTAGALDILVNDVLDSQLDETTLVMLAASHSYTLDRLGNNLTWKFNNIQLPVSIPDTDTGKGFIKFKIKPKPGYAAGDIIPNTADIFFDSNPAIVTNTFNTEFVTSLGIGLFTENSIILYPNPTHNLVQVALNNSTEIIESIMIYDILGKTVSLTSNVASNQSTIDVSNLSKGVYLVEVSTQTHLKQIKKLIIQ
ncbi:DUF7619 domain-containing protein [Flavobacterium wongokense]|uniref:DUF7619 domain-containing protein n=1 Tax=Flavobacterium wongokense TaxID=2910674 RepID=UPI001F462914|nr:T9SS type A sorting domain-containing protein [Flavobacterium sp. WG47]MCF6131091.1 T9SS type A sorting domain-containing protein [Flavobacterium sp. WG47]